MNEQFVDEWLNKLKDYWFNKDIESAVSLFKNTLFYQETPYSIYRNKFFSNR